MILFKSSRYNNLWIEKEILPYFPAIFELLLRLFKIPYVVDYDDAIFHNYDLSHNALIRFFLRKKINHVMKHASCVIVGNQYLANYAKKAGAKKVIIIPTVVDSSRYKPVKHNTPKNNLTIGWIGSPSTQKYLIEVRDAIIDICSTYNARLLVVGATDNLLSEFTEINIQIKPWHEETEVALISEMDIGIMPLIDGPWERGKCGYKLIQYMACGLPVVASPVGVNTEIVTHGENGYLAETTQEWVESLSQLLSDHSLRQTMGKSGRKRVEKTYCIQKTAPILANVLNTISR